MERSENIASTLAELAQELAAARGEQGLSQAELAQRCRLKRQQITYFETGARIPSLEQLLRIARALNLPLQRFLTGTDRPGRRVRDIAIELRNLGLIDLWVEDAVVPGAFRRAEEVVALAASGKEPEARVVEGIPALLAWNRWNGVLLRAFASATGRATIYRLGWLADIALALERRGGFPGGCPGKEDLAGFVKRIGKPPPERWDDLGRPAHEPPTSPLWKRWRINYAADLATFRERAEGLVSLAKAEGRDLLVPKG
ncbi:MAG TPA: helix-turn-helix transcriptional regulator [Gemmataceae bacterium]|nr:helix-turn-helix transcriptional regulator [Gemmataceae bacterium]